MSGKFVARFLSYFMLVREFMLHLLCCVFYVSLDSSQDLKHISYAAVGGVRSINYIRDMDTQDVYGDHKFTVNDTGVYVTYAFGNPGDALESINVNNFGNSTFLRFVPSPSSTLYWPSPVDVTSSWAKTLCPSDSGHKNNTFGGSTTISTAAGKFVIGFTFSCLNETVEISMTCPQNKWCGIVFNTLMQGDSLVYTTGKEDETRHAGLYFYNLIYYETFDNIVIRITTYLYYYHIYRPQGVVYEATRNWYESSTTTVNNQVTVKYWQYLTETNWDLSTQSITFRIAWGSSMQLAVHDGVSDTIVLGFNPTPTPTKRDRIIIYIHAILMWLAWSFFGVISVFLARNRYLFDDQEAGIWFLLHRIFGGIGLLCGLAGFALAIYYTEHYHNKHFNNLHKILGIIITFAGFQQPINGLLRPAPPANDMDTKRIIYTLWKIYHTFMGGFVCVTLGLLNVFLGMRLFNVDIKLLYAHAAWVVLVIIVFVAAEVSFFFHFVGHFYQKQTLLLLIVQKCLGDKEDKAPLSTVVNTEENPQTELEAVGAAPSSPKSGIKFVEEADAPTTKSIR
ncbi:hypothetical protein RFI_25473 [Reticulomyxa filosa]|uniref:Cytochrome b561 domain-containing protein n=1 Tax=Reticulomyxa filosa TaxID=46433 RepID=X6MD32_RETFI|nr:hypothetical protein RFI_25473 [Reticulomyxa filosa]|eukprot:ETO11903.1 hypothetical protein RFI_25473 [Reticulomyxa filosa]